MRKQRTTPRPAILAEKGEPRRADPPPTAVERALILLLVLAILAFALWSRLIVIGGM